MFDLIFMVGMCQPKVTISVMAGHGVNGTGSLVHEVNVYLVY